MTFLTSLRFSLYLRQIIIIQGLTWEECGIFARFIDDNRPRLAGIQDKLAQSLHLASKPDLGSLINFYW